MVLLFLLGGMTGRAAEVGVFFGGDPEDGLDLQGNFVYAINIGTGGAAGKAGDADFTADDAAGITVTAGNQIVDWNTAVAYGDSPADDVLETVIRSIRWSDRASTTAPQVVTVRLTGLEVGARYKLQLLFGEGCCPQRAFDIFLNGVMIVDDMNPGGLQGGSNMPDVAAFAWEEFSAEDSVLDIVLDGHEVAAEFTDGNAILSGVTLEKTSTASDTDGDGLSDAWEVQQFGDLGQTGTGDPDNDGLNNAGEMAKSSNPNNPDTDGDTLLDGAEVHTYSTDPLKMDTDADTLTDDVEVKTTLTDPLKADTDGDGLKDAVEVNRTLTNPLKPDTDEDSFSDYDELTLMTDPLDKDSKPKNTLISRFTGGDEGEGLDLDGTFLYAIHLATTPAVGPIRDANFTEETVEGVTVLAGNTAMNWHPNLNFGDSANDDLLEMFLPNIRWSDAANAAQPNLSVELANLEAGGQYKLQLLSAEEGWWRGWDVFIDGHQVANDFFLPFYQGGFTKTSGVAVVHTFVARSNLVTAVLDGRGVTNPEIIDHNALLQGLTLEVIAPPTDTDSDGLPDAWETDVFGDLSQTGGADLDGDGLTNSEEFMGYSDPKDADMDDDGLTDGEELKTYNTNPTRADSDADGLTDGAEVKTHKTDPLRADTDTDGLSDGVEIAGGTNPLDPASQFSQVKVEGFWGGDPGEGFDATWAPTDGVDLTGNFLYAVNVSTAGPAGKAYDADFTAETVPGVTIVAVNNLPNWDAPEFGDSPADDVLEKVTQSIRYAPIVSVRLTGLYPGSTYKMQMFFYEQCCPNRGFNVYADGALITENFVPAETQGGSAIVSSAAMVSFEILAKRDSLYVVLDAAAATREDLTDPNPILDGFTLEVLNLVAPPTLTLTRAANGQITVATDGTLQVAEFVSGPYTSLPDKTVTIDPATAPSPRFYRSTR